MTIHRGLPASVAHQENGMTRPDMEATERVADRLNEVIIFRSTGPWSKRWLEKGYPSKNFHVKGKSSDWGPHAGLVPFDGTYSKVGGNAEQAAKGTKANKGGLKSNFARKSQLGLMAPELSMQCTLQSGTPLRSAVISQHPIASSKDLFLRAVRSGDNKQVIFRAVWADVWAMGGQRMKVRGRGYLISVYPPNMGTNLRRLAFETPVPLEVMVSNEVGAEKPMTGDYDLFAICPSWGQFGSLSSRTISKPGIRLRGSRGVHKGLQFSAGVGMDNVLDPQLHMGGTQKSDWSNMTGQNALKEKEGGQKHRNEHSDMGNLTPRILRCINELNSEMGATGSSTGMRRVHHNAESHRHRYFGAITRNEMVNDGDGFPLTVFQPSSLTTHESPTAGYGTVCTLETYNELQTYVRLLHDAGFYVPKSWIWGLPSAFGM